MDAALPGVSRLVLVADQKHARYSEADVIELSDGRLLLALGRKDGSSDFSPGTIIGMFSRDQGLSWDDVPHVIQGPFDDVGDLMSVSFCRSRRGVHLFFLGRGPEARSDTRVYQMISGDEGKTWGKPVRVSERGGYHVVNNARVIRTKSGRMIVPSAYINGPNDTMRDRMGIYCLLSDDDGATWKRSNDLSLEGEPLMEPGVAQCGDGSFYMTIRTKLGVLYEARSRDNGATWEDLVPTKLASPAAPSTVVRAPNSGDLWMFWINRPGGTWKQRTPLSLAISHDHGETWGAPREIANAADHSFGYYSFNVIDGAVMLTYYDWPDRGQPSFQGTSLRQRVIPLDWFTGKVVPPVFRAAREPVLAEDGKIVSVNSGLLIEKDRWRLWYTHGALDPTGERLWVAYAESIDLGATWKPMPVAIEQVAGKSSMYHPSVHRAGDAIVMYVWKRDAADDSGLYRYASRDNGKTFETEPQTPLMVSNWTKAERAKEAGEGRVSNDAFDVIQSDTLWEYYAACLEKATDPKTIIKHDNAAGWLRLIGRSACVDGVNFPPPEIVIRTYTEQNDPPDTQFYGLQVFRRHGFYLGLLHTYHAESQIIQPEWAWSHDGVSWARTRIKCIPLGDEGSFDSRMIVFGALVMTNTELIWLYSGCDWRHNAFKKGKVRSCIGRATLPLTELDAWLDTLPQP